MNENQFDELLSTIDTPTDAPLDVEERVWQTLRASVFAGSTDLSAPIDSDSGAHIAEIGDATPLIASANDDRRRSVVRLLGAVAAIAVVIGLFGVLRNDRAADVDIADDPASTTPAPIDRPDACLRFRVDHPLFDEIEASLIVDPDTTRVLIESTRDGLTQLEVDLSTMGALSGPDAASAFLTIDGALNQARLFLLAGDIDAAQQAIDFAQETYRDSELAQDSCLGEI